MEVVKDTSKGNDLKTASKGLNTLCEEYKNRLVEVVNASGLPIGIVYYITKSIMTEIEVAYYGVLNSEATVYVEERKVE